MNYSQEDDVIFLAVTGGRNYKDKKHVFEVLDQYNKKNIILVLGDATGVDAFALQWAMKYNVPHTVHYANWKKHGKAAGPIRNKEMLKQANMLLAFPGGKGTENCIAQAAKAGIDIRRVDDRSKA